jgi:hypothetical protein
LNGLNEQRSLPSSLDEGSVSRDRRAIREKIETESKFSKVISGFHQAKYLIEDLATNVSFAVFNDQNQFR